MKKTPSLGSACKELGKRTKRFVVAAVVVAVTTLTIDGMMFHKAGAITGEGSQDRNTNLPSVSLPPEWRYELETHSFEDMYGGAPKASFVDDMYRQRGRTRVE